MDPVSAPPSIDIDRRELLEREASAALPAAVRDVEAAWRQVAGEPQMAGDGGPDALRALRKFTEALLRAVLTYYVQSGLSVRQRQELIQRFDRVTPRFDGSEVLRTARLVGFETLRQHLRDGAGLSRAEYLRLRTSAEHVAALVSGIMAPPPRHTDVLRRLQSTGYDLR